MVHYENYEDVLVLEGLYNDLRSDYDSLDIGMVKKSDKKELKMLMDDFFS